MSFALLAMGLASPAAAMPPVAGPPWAVEAPGAAQAPRSTKVRFSLGAESFAERQESLNIAAFDQMVSVVDLLSGVEESHRLPGDADLLNRKFDLGFERYGVGPSFAVALPTAGFAGAGKLYPTLTVGSAIADVRLDFDDVTQRRDSTSLRGRGALFETRLDLVATLCESCPWFTATGYRFEKLPTLAVDRSPRFALPGFTVPRDDVRLGRKVQEISSRVGYTAPGGRTAPFVGVQHRWTDLEIDDRLAYRNSVAETRLSSRTRLESETTLALAGVDVALGPRFFGRLETAAGGGDAIVRLGAVYLPASKDRPLTDPRLPQIAEAIGRLHAEFSREVVALPAVGQFAAARELLDRYERELLALLPLPDFAAMQSYVIYEFDRARTALASLEATAAREAARRQGLRSRREYVAVRLALEEAGSLVDSVVDVCDSVGEVFEVLKLRFGNNDVRVELCVQGDPRALEVALVPRILARDPQGRHWTEANFPSRGDFPTNHHRDMPRGLYAYRVVRNGSQLVVCSPLQTCKPLNLVVDDHPFVVCKLDGSPAGSFECKVENRERKWWKCDRVEP